MVAYPLIEARTAFSAVCNESSNTHADNSTEQTDNTVPDAADVITNLHNDNDTNSDTADDTASPPQDISVDDEGINVTDSINSDSNGTQH